MGRRSFLSAFFCGLLCCSFPLQALAAEAVVDGDKPLVLMIFDDKCKKWCSQVRPILGELKEQYGDKVAFHEIDCSENVLKGANESAKKLGVGGFLAGVLDFVPIVGVFTSKRRLVREIVGAKTKQVYIDFIESALKQSSK